MFLSVLVKCGLIRRKVVSGEMTMIICNDQWTSFRSEYELDIEIVKSKVDILVEIILSGGVFISFELEIKITIHTTKHPTIQVLSCSSSN